MKKTWLSFARLLCSAVCFIVCSAVCSVSRAEFVEPIFEGVRPTGMGNAFLAVADDDNTPWYNPAGLTRIKGNHLTLIDFTLGADGQATLTRDWDAGFNGNFESLASAGPQYLRAGLKLTFIRQYFSFTIFQNLRNYSDLPSLSSLTIPDPSNLMDPANVTALNTLLQSAVNIQATNDMGALAAIGIPLTNYLSVGASTKLIQRSSILTNFTGSDIVNAMIAAGSTNPGQTALEILKKQVGLGWGISGSVGLLATIPMQKNTTLSLAATVEDIGETTFHPFNSLPPPPPIPPTYNFGGLIKYSLGRRSELNIASDIRDIDLDGSQSSVPLFKKISVGAELRLPVLSLRGGLYQGHPTYGFGIDFPAHTRLSFSSYALEQGALPNTAYQRWYLVEMAIGFNPI